MKVRIEGVAPLIMNNGLSVDHEYYYTKERKKITSKKKKVQADHDELDRLGFLGALYTEEGRIVVPAHVLTGVIIKGAKGLKEGPQAKAGVFVNATVPLIYDGEADPEKLYEDKRFVLRVPVRQGQVSVIRVRPIFQKWAAEFELTISEDVVNPASVRQMLDQAGRMNGMGDWRPQYGRFVVTKFEK
jgi:hypothetical protein